MRYPHGFMLTFPFIDLDAEGNSVRERRQISTNDPIDHRRIKRGFRRYIKSELGRCVSSHEWQKIKKLVRVHKEPMQYFVHHTRSEATPEQVSYEMSKKYPNVRLEDEADHEVLLEDHIAAGAK